MRSQHMQVSTVAAIAALLFGAVALTPGFADDYDVHGMYIGEAPSGQTNWSDRVYGLAHDATHWYITQDSELDLSAYLWRVPATADLSSVTSGSPGVQRIAANNTLGLADTFFGDPVVHRHNGVDYLLLPVKFHGGTNIWAAVFDAASLTYIDRTLLAVAQQFHVQSFAVDAAGRLYAFQTRGGLDRWSVDWPLLQQTGELQLLGIGQQPLFAEDGVSELEIGGSIEFTPDGRFLYVVTFGDGIHVFDTQTWRRVLRSTNGPGHFAFQWEPGNDFPSGVTVWDLDSIPSWADGQLHVIVRDSDMFNDDDVFLKHYTRSIRVRAGASPPGAGTPSSPFPTVGAAANLAWPGAEIRIINGGVFNETLTINKRVRLVARGGTARIGG